MNPAQDKPHIIVRLVDLSKIDRKNQPSPIAQLSDFALRCALVRT